MRIYCEEWHNNLAKAACAIQYGSYQPHAMAKNLNMAFPTGDALLSRVYTQYGG